MIGGLDVGVFKEAGRRYDIRMRLERRRTATTPRRSSASTCARATATWSSCATWCASSSARRRRRSRATDRQRSVTVAANLDGKPARRGDRGRARDRRGGAAAERARSRWRATPSRCRRASSQAGIAIGLGVLVIYMVLAAQFESLVHPLTVMLALPLAMTGALGGLLAVRPDAEPVQPDRDPAAVRAGHEELDPARRLRATSCARGHGQGRGDPHGGADPHAARC